MSETQKDQLYYGTVGTVSDTLVIFIGNKRKKLLRDPSNDMLVLHRNYDFDSIYGYTDDYDTVNYADPDDPINIDLVHPYKIVKLHCKARQVVDVSLFPDSVEEIYADKHVIIVGDYPPNLRILSTVGVVRQKNPLPNLTHLCSYDIPEDFDLSGVSTLICSISPAILPRSLVSLACSELTNLEQNTQVLNNLKKLSCSRGNVGTNLISLEFLRIRAIDPALGEPGGLKSLCPNLKKLAIISEDHRYLSAYHLSKITKYPCGWNYTSVYNKIGTDRIFQVSDGISTAECCNPFLRVNFDTIPDNITDLFLSPEINISDLRLEIYPFLNKLHCSMYDRAILGQIKRSESITKLALNISRDSEFWTNKHASMDFVDTLEKIDNLSIPGLSKPLIDTLIESETCIDQLFLNYHPKFNIRLLPFKVIIMSARVAGVNMGKASDDNPDTSEWDENRGAIDQHTQGVPSRYYSSGEITIPASVGGARFYYSSDGDFEYARVTICAHNVEYTALTTDTFFSVFGSPFNAVNIMIPDEFVPVTSKSARK